MRTQSNCIFSQRIIASCKCGRDCWVNEYVSGWNLMKSAKFEPLLTMSSQIKQVKSSSQISQYQQVNQY